MVGINPNMAAADGLSFVFVFIFGTMITWWAVGNLRWDKFVHDPFGSQARFLRLIMGIMGGALFGLIAILYVLAIQLLGTIG